MVAYLQGVRSWFILLGFTLVVAACGGGGGGGDDTTPNNFSFTSATNAALSTVIESNTVTISGLSVSVSVSVSDGEYAKNGGTYVSSAGTVSNGDTISVRGTSSSEFGDDVVVSLTVGSTVETFTITTLAQDTTPAAFAFTAQTNVVLSTVVESNEITVAEINDAAPISISGGEFSVNDGVYTATAGTVNSGDMVKVRLTSSAEFSTAETATIDIGGVTADFTATTLAADTTPDSFSLAPVTGVALSSTAESEVVTISGINTAAVVSITSGEYKINDGDYTNEIGSINDGDTIQVRSPTSSNFSDTLIATLVVGGVEAPFSVTTIAQDLTPDEFSFTSATNASVGATVASQTVEITGITGAVPISVAGGWYSIEGAPSTPTAGVIENGQSVYVTVDASDEFSTKTTVDLTIGNLTRTFSVTTEARDIIPDAFSFGAETEADIETDYISNSQTISGINDDAPITITNGAYRIDGGAFTSAEGTITEGQSVEVRVTSSSHPNEVATATLSIGGLERTFSVTTLVDEVEPTAEIIFPTPYTYTEVATLILRGVASDELSDIETVSLTVTSTNGVFGTHEATLTVEDDVTTWIAEVDLEADLENTVSISVTDSSGNENTSVDEIVTYYALNVGSSVFPVGETVSLDNQHWTEIRYDEPNNRLLITQDEEIVVVDITTGDRSVVDMTGDASSIVRLFDLHYVNNNEVYLSDVAVPAIFKLDLETGIVSTYSSNAVTSEVDMVSPAGLHMHQNGLLYVLDGGNNSLYSIDSDGIRSLVSSNTMPDASPLLATPIPFLLFEEDSRALVFNTGIADPSEKLIWLDIFTGERTEISSGSLIPSSATDLTFDSENNRVIFEYGVERVMFNLDTEETVDKSSEIGTNNYPLIRGEMINTELIRNDVLVEGFISNDELWISDLVTGERVFIAR